MHPQKIMTLLNRAAADTKPEVIAEIRKQLGESAFPLYKDTVVSLFDQTIRHSPKSLPHLFGAFALFCGDRAFDAKIAIIAWWAYCPEVEGINPLQDDWTPL